MMTESEAVVSIMPALFSALQVYLPASRLVTVNIVMVPVCSSTFTPDIDREVYQMIRNKETDTNLLFVEHQFPPS